MHDFEADSFWAAFQKYQSSDFLVKFTPYQFNGI